MPPLPVHPDVFFCLTGDLRTNSRALRQLDALSEAGITVEAVGIAPVAADETPSPTLRMIHYERPDGSGPTWFWKIHRVFRAHLHDRSARLFHASDLFVLPALSQRARQSDASLTFDSRELYPQVGATAGKPWASLFWSTVERRYIPRADAVFTVNDSIADILVDRYGIDRPLVVPNVPLPHAAGDRTYLREWTRAEDGALILLLQGHLKPGRGCELTLRALERAPGLHLVFMGDGPLRLRLEELATELGLVDRVHFHPPVSPRRLLDVTSSADLGICLIEPLTESLRLSLPNKLFEYLRADVPVLASPLPEIQAVVEGLGVGRVVPELTPEAVAKTLLDIRSDRRQLQAWRSHIPAVFETFDPQKASDAFASTISRLLEVE